MTKLITSGADDGPKNDDGQAGNADRAHDDTGRRKHGSIPSKEACLAALAQLAGAVALGLLKPAQANAMRTNYVEILRHHQRNESRDDRQGIANEDVVELMRSNPQAFSILEPFLTDDQIDMVMRGSRDGKHEQA